MGQNSGRNKKRGDNENPLPPINIGAFHLEIHGWGLCIFLQLSQ
jgi:hypothetical protein